jgi:hypothetical protein
MGAAEADIQASEELAAAEAEQTNRKLDKQATKRKKAAARRPRMVFPESMEREIEIIDPNQNLEGYKIIGEETKEVLVMVPASFNPNSATFYPV